MPIRPEKVAHAIKKEIAKLIQEELRDPRIGFATVTDVEVTNDLRICKIFISVLGDEKSKKSTLIALEHAKGFIKKLIADRVKLRFTPDVLFRLDQTAEYGEHIDEIFKKIDLEKKEHGDK